MTDYILETIKAGILETLAMTFFSSVFSYLFGLPLGILLYATSKGRIMENKPVNFVIGLIVNIGLYDNLGYSYIAKFAIKDDVTVIYDIFGRILFSKKFRIDFHFIHS